MATLPVTGDLRATFGDDVRLLPLKAHVDSRGKLVEIDFATIPFEARRVFVVTGAQAGTVRGGHRHRYETQVLCCLSGGVEVELRHAGARDVLELTPETGALYVAPGVWSRQRYLTAGASLLVIASGRFDPSDYEPRH